MFESPNFDDVLHCRILPKVIGYFLVQKFKIHIQFGRIKFPFLLRDVKIVKQGISVVSIADVAPAHHLT